MSRRSRWLALLTGIGLALATTTSVFGYVTQVPHIITITPSSGTLTCGVWHIVRAKVLDLTGHPIEGLTVTWSIASSPSSADKLKKSQSKTNDDGVAVTRVKLACVPGDRVITGSVEGISGSAVVHVTGDDGQVLGITGKPGLPNTSTSPADGSTDGLPLPAIPLVVALLGVMAIIVRRFAFPRP